MSIDHFNHVTINTAHSSKSHRADVPPEAMIVMRKWLSEAIQSDDAYPLPVPALSNFSYQVSVLGSGGLIATVFAPAAPHIAGQPYHGDVLPLVTFCLITNQKHSIKTWDSLKNAFGHLMQKDLKLPHTPWLAVAAHPSTPVMTGNYQDTMSWLADFERCVA